MEAHSVAKLKLKPKKYVPPFWLWKQVTRSKLKRLLVKLRLRKETKVANTSPLLNEDRVNRFNIIYRDEIWRGECKDTPRSGPGSSMEATQPLREFIDRFVTSYNIESIIDIGCGDLSWMPLTQAFKSCQYTGIDINEQLIEQHTKEFPQHSFICQDVVLDIPAKGDLVIIRDVIFHMAHEEVISMLVNSKRKFRYFLITSCQNAYNNSGFNEYHFHDLNLFLPPFGFSQYLWRVSEPTFNRYVYLFSQDQIKV